MVEPNKIKQSNLSVTVSGKVMKIEDIQGRDRVFYINRIMIPAPDQFSRPTEVPIHSEKRFCNVDEIVNDIVCDVQFSKRFGGDNRWFDNVSLWAQGK